MNCRLTNDELIDWLGITLIFLFSSRDCIVRLLPIVLWNAVVLLFVVLFIVSLLLKNNRINFYSSILLCSYYLVVIISWLIGTKVQQQYIIDLVFDISSVAALWLYLFVLATINNPSKIMRWLQTIAYCNLILLMITTLSGVYSSSMRSINYIGLGLNAMVWISIIIQKAFEKGRFKVYHIVASVVFSFFLVIYGNRGAVLAVGIFGIFCIFKYTTKNHKVFLSILTSIFLFLVVCLHQIILNILINIVANFGIDSRNLKLLLAGNLSYTTHRMDDIWIKCILYIKQNWIFGYGLCFDRLINGDGSRYAHNLILEVWLSFGIIIGSILLIIHGIIGVKMLLRMHDDIWMKLFAPFYITSTIVLFFNSSFCILPAFWASYGLYFAFLKAKRKEHRIINEK